MSFLVDTDVVSEVRKRSPAQTVAEWYAATPADELYLSVLVIGEIRHGIERLRARDATAAGVYDRWLDRLRADFADRVLPVDLAVAEEWGTLNASRPLPVVDGLLAATAPAHGLTLVTRDVSQLAGAGVQVLDPWAREGDDGGGGSRRPLR